MQHSFPLWKNLRVALDASTFQSQAELVHYPLHQVHLLPWSSLCTLFLYSSSTILDYSSIARSPQIFLLYRVLASIHSSIFKHSYISIRNSVESSAVASFVLLSVLGILEIHLVRRLQAPQFSFLCTKYLAPHQFFLRFPVKIEPVDIFVIITWGFLLIFYSRCNICS